MQILNPTQLNSRVGTMSTPIKIHHLEAAPGTKAFGYLMMEDSTSITVKLPLGIVNGAKPGPVMCITGGLYGTEYCGIESAIRLYHETDPNELSGTLLIVPIVNYPALQFRTPMMQITSGKTPFDWSDVNRSFPGDLNGNVSQVIAFKFFNDILLKAQYHIDYRGGDLPESHAIHTIFCGEFGNDDLANKCKELAKVFGMPYVMPSDPTIGHTTPSTLIYEALQKGIVSFISEAGIGTKVQPEEEFVQWHLKGTRRVMQHLGMLVGTPSTVQGQKLLAKSADRVHATKTGVFRAFKDYGEVVKTGDLLGRIMNFEGETIKEVRSPIDGYIHCMYPRYLVRNGDLLFNVFKITGDI